MNRSDFLKSIGLGAGGFIIPEQNIFVQKRSVKIYDNYIKGTEHYKYSKVSHKIKEGDELILIREPDNHQDAFAIQVFYGSDKIGYIAAFENIVLANMLDAGVELNAFVSMRTDRYQVYNSIALEVFADIVIPTPKLIEHLFSERRADDAIDQYRGSV